MVIVHSDIQEVYRSSRIVTVLVLKFTRAQGGAITLLNSYLMLKHFSVVERSVFSVGLHGHVHNCLHNCLLLAHSKV